MSVVCFTPTDRCFTERNEESLITSGGLSESALQFRGGSAFVLQIYDSALIREGKLSTF